MISVVSWCWNVIVWPRFFVLSTFDNISTLMLSSSVSFLLFELWLPRICAVLEVAQHFLELLFCGSKQGHIVSNAHIREACYLFSAFHESDSGWPRATQKTFETESFEATSAHVTSVRAQEGGCPATTQAVALPWCVTGPCPAPRCPRRRSSRCTVRQTCHHSIETSSQIRLRYVASCLPVCASRVPRVT